MARRTSVAPFSPLPLLSRPQAAAWRQTILVAYAAHGGRSRPQPAAAGRVAAERCRVKDFDPSEPSLAIFPIKSRIKDKSVTDRQTTPH